MPRYDTLRVTPRTEFVSTYKTGRLAATLTEAEIIAKLGQPTHLDPNDPDSDGKVTIMWDIWATPAGDLDPHPCGVWDFKDVRWSTYGPHAVFKELFGALYSEGPY